MILWAPTGKQTRYLRPTRVLKIVRIGRERKEIRPILKTKIKIIILKPV
jgi:hypothetical protein